MLQCQLAVHLIYYAYNTSTVYTIKIQLHMTNKTTSQLDRQKDALFKNNTASLILDSILTVNTLTV